MAKSRTEKLPKYTAYWLMKTSAELFRDKPMQMHKDDSKEFQSLSYSECYDKIKSIGCGLIELGLEKGDPVGLIADVGPKFMWASMGINNIGGVDVPRGTDATREDLKYIFEHTDCKFIVLETPKVFEKMKNDLEELKNLKHIIFLENTGAMPQSQGATQFLQLSELIEKGQAALSKNKDLFDQWGEKVAEDDLETIIYTSGTTGAPKGVMLTHKSLNWEVETMYGQLNLEIGTATMGFLPPWHIAERLIETNNIFGGGYVAFTSVPNLAADLKAI